MRCQMHTLQLGLQSFQARKPHAARIARCSTGAAMRSGVAVARSAVLDGSPAISREGWLFSRLPARARPAGRHKWVKRGNIASACGEEGRGAAAWSRRDVSKGHSLSASWCCTNCRNATHSRCRWHWKDIYVCPAGGEKLLVGQRTATLRW